MIKFSAAERKQLAEFLNLQLISTEENEEYQNRARLIGDTWGAWDALVNEENRLLGVFRHVGIENATKFELVEMQILQVYFNPGMNLHLFLQADGGFYVMSDSLYFPHAILSGIWYWKRDKIEMQRTGPQRPTSKIKQALQAAGIRLKGK